MDRPHVHDESGGMFIFMSLHYYHAAERYFRDGDSWHARNRDSQYWPNLISGLIRASLHK